jgi:hypothetical protein
VNVNNNNYTCCAKMAGKEETPKCRKKTVTRTNEMIEDLIDFIEIHPIVAFEAIYEPMLTLFWSLISLLRRLIRILFSDLPISIQVPSKLNKNSMHFYSIQVASSFLIQLSCMIYTIKKLEFNKLEWRLGCKTCIVYTGLNSHM